MKRKQNTQWGIIGLLILMIPSSLIVNNHLRNSTPIDHVTLNNDEDKRTVLDTVKSTEYSPDFTGKGKDCDIALTQSLVDTSGITISNASDPLNHTFYEPCPTTQNFPSSVVNMTIEDITVLNKTFIIEDSPPVLNTPLNPNIILTSFTINESCYLSKGSFYLRVVNTQTIEIFFYNSTWDPVNSRSKPDTDSQTYLTTVTPTDINNYLEVDLNDLYLNNTKTENDTWFIGLTRTTGGTGSWYCSFTDTGYQAEAYSWDGALTLTHLLFDEYLCSLVFAPIKSYETLIVQDNPFDSGTECSSDCYTSFKVNTDCYLINASLNLRQQNSPSGNIYLVNSSWNSSVDRSEPNPDSAILLATIAPIANGWLDVDLTNFYLNNSKTDNNTWFIRVWETSAGTTLEWRFTDDTAINNNSLAYIYSNGWVLQAVDYCLVLGLESMKRNPDEIGLTINNTAVIGNEETYGTGYWSSTEEYSSASGSLGLTISADWWDVACTITVVQINYIKTDLTAHSNFSIAGSGQEVLWNVTDSEGLNYLDARITESTTINFTIPTSWKDINVFNGTMNKTADISIRSLNNGYREIHVLNAGSGYWFLTASSANLLESIDTYVASDPINIITYSDIVTFNATFKEKITQNDGIIQLSVYSPAAKSNRLNYTLTKSTFDSEVEFSLGAWDVSDNVTDYGEFRVQVSWNNDTAAAFRETGLTIIGETKLTLIAPAQDTTYYSNETFNILVYYEDSNQLKAIVDSTLFYNIDAQGWRTTTTNNGSSGYYTILIDCSSFTTNGTKKVDITATKDYYLNQTLRYDFNIIVIEEDGGPTQTPPPDITPIIILGLSVVVVVGVVGFIKREAVSKGLSAMVQKIRPPKED